jgi:wyosine [tRNA(Phe)-imidazoG37] synthetase (radical SAM superfamily)
MTYTYGPVSSWRYGRSLGVDITTPPKKCTFNCVYCQLGPTKKHVATLENIQDEMPSSPDILKEVIEVLKRLDLRTIDAVTFSGAGEPTLNMAIGTIADEILREVENVPVILLTNASLLPLPNVRSSLTGFDIISAKLDAGDDETFKLVNRPAKGTFGLDEITDGIKKLHKQMSGLLALEVMLLRGPRGLTNATGQARKSLIERVLEINPDIVQIYTPWRPPAMKGVRSLPQTILNQFGNELGEYLTMNKIWVYGVHDARGKQVKWREHKTIELEIMKMLKRRPCRITDISASLGIQKPVAMRAVRNLLKGGKVAKKVVDGDVFYSVGKEGAH